MLKRLLTLLLVLVPVPASRDPDCAASPVHGTVAETRAGSGVVIPEPTGPVVLTVDGRTGFPAPVRFDRGALEGLGLTRLTTATNRMAVPSLFEGVPLVAVLDAVGSDATATTLVLTGLDDLAVRVPIASARTWPVLLALRRDGASLSRRDGGPIRMVHPPRRSPKPGQDMYLLRWVEQLKSITVE